MASNGGTKVGEWAVEKGLMSVGDSVLDAEVGNGDSNVCWRVRTRVCSTVETTLFTLTTFGEYLPSQARPSNPFIVSRRGRSPAPPPLSKSVSWVFSQTFCTGSSDRELRNHRKSRMRLW